MESVRRESWRSLWDWASVRGGGLGVAGLVVFSLGVGGYGGGGGKRVGFGRIVKPS